MQSSESRSETRAPVVDLLECLALLLVPALGFGLTVAVFGGRENLVPGLVVGGMSGAMLMGLRRGFYAVRTDDGIERRLKEASDSPDENPWVRLSEVTDDLHDERYDPLLAIVFAVIGFGAFAAMPFLGDDLRLFGLLGVVGLVGITSSLMIVGQLLSR